MDWLWVTLGIIGIAILLVVVVTFLILVFAAVQLVKGQDDIFWRK